MLKRAFRILLLCLLSSPVVYAQSTPETTIPEKVVPKELNFSSSSIFEVMGVTPSQITKSSDVKDFKVDWSFKAWRLNPNISLQGQPVWEMFYNRADMSKYVNASAFMQKLASLEVSVGTVQDEGGNRRLGFAGKMNILRSHDPLLKRGFFDETLKTYQDEIKVNRELKISLKAALDTTKDVAQYKALSVQLIDCDNRLNEILTRQRDEVMSKSKQFADQYWNTSFLDIGGGSVYTYKTDSAGSLKELKVNKQTGQALWMTGGVGLGKRWLITAMVKSMFYDEKINFVLRDTVSLEQTPSDTTVKNVLMTYGINIRYGTPYFNLFFEYFTDQRSVSDKKQVVLGGNTGNGQLPPTVVVDITSITWNLQPVHSLTLGGDWRISRNLGLNFGLRMEFDKIWKKQTFIPITTLTCLMR